MIEAITKSQGCPFTIANRHEAEGAGFTIEGDICFLVHLGDYAVGCVGPCYENGQIVYWRFDTIDHEARPLGFCGKDATDVLDRAIRCARSVGLYQQGCKQIGDIDLESIVKIYTPKKNIVSFGEEDEDNLTSFMTREPMIDPE